MTRSSNSRFIYRRLCWLTRSCNPQRNGNAGAVISSFPSGRKNAANLAESFQIIVNMFNDIRCENQIKTLTGERHAAHITVPNRAKALIPAVADGRLVEIQSVYGAETEVAQKPEIGTRRSPNIKNSNSHGAVRSC